MRAAVSLNGNRLILQLLVCVCAVLSVFLLKQNFCEEIILVCAYTHVVPVHGLHVFMLK